MPIRPELKHYYGAEWRKQIRPRILDRDGHCCAFCGKPNHSEVYQIVEPGRRMWWIEERFRKGAVRRRLVTHNGHTLSWNADELPLMRGYTVRVVLTVAHLDHDPANMDEANLAALCQWCHLHHDQQHHANTRATRKDQERPILVAALHKCVTA